MLRGQSQPRSLSGRRALGRCKSKSDIDNVVIIDVDVAIIDAPETSHQGSRGLTATRRNVFPSGAINIDDEEGDTDGTPRNVHGDTTSNTFCPASSNSPLAEESDSDECLVFVRKRNFPSKSTAKMRIYGENVSSRNCFGLDLTSESSASKSESSNNSGSASSESDSSDCEIMEDSSGNIREQWERAALRKRTLAKDRFGSEDWASASGSSGDPVSSSSETTHDKVDVENFINRIYLNHCEDIPTETSPTNSGSGKPNVSSSVPTADKPAEDPLLETNVNTCVADSVPTSGVSHSHEGPGFQNKEELISDKCPHRAHSSDETLFDHKRAPFRDVEVPLPGLSCNSRLLHDVHYGVSFQDKMEEVPGEPLCDTQSCRNLNVDHEVFDFHGKEKSVFEPSLCNSQLSHGLQPTAGSDCFCGNEEATLGEPICNHHSGSGTTERDLSSHTEPGDLPQVHTDLISERERHKESDEYKRAAEEEWASRLQQLQIQAEEAQRLRKRKKAERLLLDMERRQKQRLEEIRESQRKDEETINLKEKLRAEVRTELDKMELRYRDMASLLRGLGIHVEGGLYPMSREVNAAYKRALLRFHPDRSSRTDIRQQVEAEEKFKLVSRLKEKLLPMT